ncbi:MAG: YitT family protein [Bacteroidetes bacterium]|nr:YitT family protein [Bacteroidota bacterium]MBT5531014.1 YitT family protein [Cytophagia bacterium]MBT3423797.1 YitT family protein [Bacteroidota bacterium]MBT3933916.1 YitT family protein [Bacteroidota bacterium]MBT4340057.1 YitT family protein [Bacteroidota bacterium]
MNPVYQYIVTETIKRKIKQKNQKLPVKQYEKEVTKVKVELKHLVRDSFFIALGILSACVGLNGFLLPNMFIDGGVTGISLILTELTGVPLSVLLVLVNIPFIIMAFSTISRKFALRSMLAIILLAISVHFIHMPIITADKLLIAVFGGFFLGLGIGLSIRGGSVIDGTEVLAVFISKKTSMTIGDVILVFNVLIFMAAAYVFSIEISLYAMLTYLSASKTVDFVVSGIEEYLGITIISEKNEEIRLAITEKLGRGCTIYFGKKGFAKEGKDLQPIDIVYTLITRLELAKLHTEIDKIDEDAFIVMHSIKDAKGGMIKKRPLK